MNTPEQRARTYRLKAEEIRTAAEDMHRPETRTGFLRIARDYDLMADNIETLHKLHTREAAL
jgi:hypothetical protein